MKHLPITRRRACLPGTLLLSALTIATAQAGDAPLPPDLRGSIAVYGVHVTDDNATLRLEERDLLAGTTQASASFAAGVRGNGGVRAMAWQAGAPWLAGFDIGYFDARSPNLEIRVLPLSVFLGARLPQGLPPGGPLRVQPFALAGVSTFASWGNARAGTLASSFRAGRSMLAPGGDNLHAAYFAFGVTVPLARDWALEADWRVQHWQVNSIETNSLFLPTRNLVTDVTLDGSGFALGIAWTPGASP